MIDIDNRDFTSLCLCAFRYAIDRKTGISHEMSRLLNKYSNHLDEWAKDQIKRDIQNKLDTPNLDAFDKINWESLRRAL